MQNFGKSALRVAKNYTKGYSDVQAKVRDATSNDPWGPSGTQMNEIAQLTYNQNDFVEIMEMLDKRLNDKGKNWRHVFKALTVLDYCLHAGSENVVIYFRDNLYIIKTLKEFVFVDEYGKDQGANVRQKAKDITNLLMDENRLKEERRSRAHMRDRMTGRNGDGGPGGDEDGEDFDAAARRTRPTPARAGGGGGGREEDELRRAIEESKRSLADEQAKKGYVSAEDRDLQQAIRMSEEEEAKRSKAVEDANSRSLFDVDAAPTPTTNGANPFPLIDASQQPQYGQLQPQFTQVAPQFTSFNPYAQQMQQEAMQQEYLRQQQQWEMQQQAQLAAQQQAQIAAQQQAQLAAQQQAQLAAQQQAEYMRQQQQWELQQQAQLANQQQAQLAAQQELWAQQQQQPPFMQAQPTGFGSNNPFALGSATPGQGGIPPLPTAASPAPSASTMSSLPLGASASPPPSISPTGPPRVRTDGDAQHAQLANFLANRGDGLDTFGNMGNLRFGHSQAGRLQATQTGHNPFSLQQPQAQTDQPFFLI